MFASPAGVILPFEVSTQAQMSANSKRTRQRTINSSAGVSTQTQTQPQPLSTASSSSSSSWCSWCSYNDDDDLPSSEQMMGPTWARLFLLAALVIFIILLTLIGLLIWYLS
jgi:hypothetical protein